MMHWWWLLLLLSALAVSSFANLDGDSWFKQDQNDPLPPEIEDFIKRTLQDSLDNTKQEVLKLKKEAVKEIQKERNEALTEIQHATAGAKEEIEKVRVEAQQEILKVKQEAREEIQKIKHEAHEEIVNIKQEAEILKVRLMYHQDLVESTAESNSPHNHRTKRSTSVTEAVGAAGYTVLEQLVKLMAPISCYEWFQYGFNISGKYLIDPDGKGMGEPPFTVYCDMVTGYTFILHDSEGSLQADSCSGDRCYTKEISYSASMKQIQSLMLVSDSCQQYIKIDCLNSPLKTGDQSLALWMDRHGEYHDFWAGSSSNHTCSCGLSQSCVDPRETCHCDANVDGVWLRDEGYLSDMDFLPVQRLTFGSPEPETLQINHTLGPLRCFGRQPPKIPHSCNDLIISGTSQSGYFLLENDGVVDLVYCNFTDAYLNIHAEEDMQETRVQLRGVMELQELIDQELVLVRNQMNNETKVQFIAHSSLIGAKNNHFIVYDEISENIGEAYDNSTGLFTAPVAGVYYFSVIVTTSARVIGVKVSIEKNYDKIAEYNAKLRNNDNTFVQLLDLEKGDWVGVKLNRGRDKRRTGSTFKGFLLSKI